MNNVMIDRRFVERTRRNEVLLLDGQATSSRMRASGSIPGSHSRMPWLGGPLREAVVLEVFRQAGLFMAHAGLGMPTGWRLITTRFGMTWRKHPPQIGVASVFWFDVSGQASVERRGSKASYLRFAAEMVWAGRVVADGFVEAYSVAPDLYRAFRRPSHRTPPTADPVVGSPSRETPENEQPVQRDDSDPFLFDQPTDHIVSMALIETVLAAAASPGKKRKAISVDMEFLKFAECSDPITLVCEERRLNGERAWELRQAGQAIARAVTSTAAPGRRTPLGP